MLTNGLHEALNLYLRDGRIVLNTIASLNASQLEEPGQRDAVVEMTEHLHVLDRTFLQEGMERSIRLLYEDADTVLATFGDVLLATAIVMAVVTAYYYLFSYRPAVHFMVSCGEQATAGVW